ncbi:MAG: AAA family ATPase [Ignavibacteriaceae bacterium]
MTTLIFDYDGSLASIGSEEVLLRTFGIMPIRIQKGLEQTKLIMKKLIKPVRRKLDHPLLENSQVIEEGFELSNKAEQLNLSCIAFDTASALGLQERNQIKIARHIDSLDLRSWNYYGDNLNSFIYNICSLPVKTIFNAHSDREKDVGDRVIEYPALKGGSKSEIQKWFDCIFYTKVLQDSKTDEYSYCWLTKPEDGRFAKDRLGILPAIIPQDFNLVFSKYEESGIYHPNILVIGESGTGKSKALATINGYSQKKSKLKIAS